MSEINGEKAAVPVHSKRLGRELAMEFLFSCELQNEFPGAEKFGQFLEAVQDEFMLGDNRQSHRAVDYARRLYECVALNQEQIDAIIRRYCENWDWERLSKVECNIMRIAIAEMLKFDEVPLVVSIDEAVEIARDFSGVEAGNFINGVLNSVKNQEFSGKRAER
ncbi:MAG: transcription antitermination factor NusB [Lentisphaeria bacterium]|nr:transcription antitermination factor NusB [Lentisphaeria bacterium]